MLFSPEAHSLKFKFRVALNDLVMPKKLKPSKNRERNEINLPYRIMSWKSIKNAISSQTHSLRSKFRVALNGSSDARKIKTLKKMGAGVEYYILYIVISKYSEKTFSIRNILYITCYFKN